MSEFAANRADGPLDREIDPLAGRFQIDGSQGASAVMGSGVDDLFVFTGVLSTSKESPVGVIDGGAGFDTVDLSNVAPSSLGTFQDADRQSYTGVRVGTINYRIANVERVILGDQSDFVSLSSSTPPMEVHAGGGNDNISVYGGVSVFGGSGDDVMRLSGFGTTGVVGRIEGGTGRNRLETNIDFTIDLQSGIAKSFGATFSIADFQDVSVTTYAGYTSSVHGDANNNVFSTQTFGDDGRAGVIFDGRGGNDTLTGSNGNDQLYGGDGNDVIRGRGGNDVIDGGAGMDTASYTGLFQTYVVGHADSVTTLRGSANEGTDTLTSVEIVTFRDGQLLSDPNGDGAKVVRLYNAVLGRGPDPVGVDYWLDELHDRGGSIEQVAQSFINSAEFQVATGGLSNAGFVDHLYATTLGRVGDPGGRAFWTEQLDGGASRADVLLGFSESAEHRARTADAVAQGVFETDDAYQAVTLFYDGFTNRLPDADGLTYWAESLKGGTITLSAMATNFAASTEFQGAIKGKSNADLVDYMYQNTLDRPADGAGKAFWVDKLNAGLSHGELLLGFSQSAEHYALLAPSIADGIHLI